MDEINQVLSNWENSPAVEIPRQQFSLRLPAPLAAKIIALADIYKRNRAEIMTDLMEYAVSRASASMSRQKFPKSQIWREIYKDFESKHGEPPPAALLDGFNESYLGDDSEIHEYGEGWIFDRRWREQLNKMAAQVHTEETAQ